MKSGFGNGTRYLVSSRPENTSMHKYFTAKNIRKERKGITERF